MAQAESPSIVINNLWNKGTVARSKKRKEKKWKKKLKCENFVQQRANALNIGFIIFFYVLGYFTFFNLLSTKFSL